MNQFSVTVQVRGLLELQMRLEELGVVKVPLAMRKVLVAGAKPLREAIRAAAPLGTRTSVSQSDAPGNLRKGVRYKSGKTTKALGSFAGAKGAMSYAVIGPFGKSTAHRHLIISGHEIVGHAPNLTRTGKRTTPNPFVERGRKSGEGPALAAVNAAARVALEEATRL